MDTNKFEKHFFFFLREQAVNEYAILKGTHFLMNKLE